QLGGQKAHLPTPSGNPTSLIRNKFKRPNLNDPNPLSLSTRSPYRPYHGFAVSVIGISEFEFVSDFGFRIYHRSSSAAMMFRLPRTATTSLSWWPTIRYGNIAK